MTEKTTIQFKDTALQKKFEDEGYVLMPFLEDNQTEKLQYLYSSYEDYIDKSDRLKYSSAQNTSVEIASEISEKILQVIQPAFDKHFTQTDTLLAAFLIKPPLQTKENAIPWHQALSLVDESAFDAAMGWIGLENKNNNNWTFNLIPRSHLFDDYVRIAPKYPLYFGRYLSIMTPFSQKITLKKGYLLVFNNRLLNASPKNIGNIESKSIQFPIKPSKAEWKYFVADSARQNSIQVYHADKSYFLNLWINKKYNSKKPTHEILNNFESMSLKDYLKFIKLTIF